MRLRNQFVLGDCFSAISKFGADTVDHIVTDPPFNDHVHGGNRRGWEKKNGKKVPTKAMPMAFDALTREQREEIAFEMVRVCRGWILVFCALEDIGLWQRSLTRGFYEHGELVMKGAKRRNTCIWTKSVYAPKFAGDGPANPAEAIVTAWGGKGRSLWNAGGSSGHYHFPVDLRDRRHETQKPLPLMMQLLLDFTRPGELVLDPFAGGASTLIAAKQIGRSWLGYERTAEAHEKGMARLRETVVETEQQQRMLHQLRRDSAYAGKRPKTMTLQQVALPIRGSRMPRSLDEVGT